MDHLRDAAEGADGGIDAHADPSGPSTEPFAPEMGARSGPSVAELTCLCGYDLRGLADDAKCPECGLALRVARRMARRRANQRDHVAILVCLTVWLFAGPFSWGLLVMDPGWGPSVPGVFLLLSLILAAAIWRLARSSGVEGWIAPAVVLTVIVMLAADAAAQRGVTLGYSPIVAGWLPLAVYVVQASRLFLTLLGGAALAAWLSLRGRFPFASRVWDVTQLVFGGQLLAAAAALWVDRTPIGWLGDSLAGYLGLAGAVAGALLVRSQLHRVPWSHERLSMRPLGWIAYVFVVCIGLLWIAEVFSPVTWPENASYPMLVLFFALEAFLWFAVLITLQIVGQERFPRWFRMKWSP